MKFFTDEGEIVTMRADQAITLKYYNASLKVIKKKKKEDKEEVRPPSSSKVILVDLDTRWREGKKVEPKGELEVVQNGRGPSQMTRINKALLISLKQDLVALLKSNADLSTWATADMLGIDQEFMCHQLLVFLRARLVAQKEE